MTHRLISLAFLCVGLTASGLPVLTPEYELEFANAGQVQELFRENPWAKEFQQSNLYRGLMVRLAPALFASAEESQKDAWKGRLIDFLYEKLLQGKRVTVAYHHYPRLVSPFGVRVEGLTAVEQTLVTTLVGQLKNGEPQQVDLSEGKVKQHRVLVQPIVNRMQKFALVTRGGCLVVSRDPVVAASQSLKCNAPTPKGDAVVGIELAEFFPAWYPLLQKLVGLGKRAEFKLDWDAKGKRFTPAVATVPLKPDHLLGSGKLDETVLSAIPADAELVVTAFLPDPGTLSLEAMQKYLRATRGELGGKPSIPITLVHLGAQVGKKGNGEGLTVLLIPQKDIGNKLFADIDALFNQRTTYELKYKRVCGTLVALAARQEALSRIETACKATAPTFRQLSPAMVRALSEEISSGVYLNTGGFLASSLALGWDAASASPPPEAGGTARAAGKAPLPTELSEARTLVAKLPSYLLAGKASREALTLNGIK